MIDKKAPLKAISTQLKTAGFVKKGSALYLDGKDTISVINLQRLNWSDQYYINVGFYLKKLGEDIYPQYNHCHLYYRLERLFPDYRELIANSCSLSVSDTKKLAELAEFCKMQLIPFLKECAHESKLRELMIQGKLDHGFVRAEIRAYLSNQNIG